MKGIGFNSDIVMFDRGFVNMLQNQSGFCYRINLGFVTESIRQIHVTGLDWEVYNTELAI